jgi:GPH family glycoside/pentoside/hexuronide:cation symporter
MEAPLTLREKLAYGFGDAACNLFWKTFAMFLLFFYTDVFGLAPAAVGLLLLVSRVVAAVFDPIVGFVADRTTTRWGKFRPYLLWMAVPFGIAGIFTFTTPHLGHDGKIVYAYMTYTAMMLVYAAINIPYSALLGVISPHSVERTRAAAFRFVFAFGGSMVVQFSLQPLVARLGGGNEANGYQRTAIVFATAAIAFFLLCFAGTKERVAPLRQSRGSLRTDLRDLATNTPWLVLLGLMVVMQVASSMRDGTILYYFKYYLGDVGAASAFMATGSLSAMLGILLAQRGAARVGKMRLFTWLMLGSAAAMAASYWTRPSQLAWLYASHVALNLCFAPAFVIIWAMKADTVDYSEWKTGRRATGLTFSATGVASKFGWALGGALTAWMLSLFGFKANAVQSDEALRGIRFMISLCPAAAAIAAALVVRLYRLDDTFMSRIEAELETRRAT